MRALWSKANWRVRIFEPGERALARLEVAMALILVTCISVNAILTNRSNQQAVHEQQAAQLKAIGPLLCETSKQLVASGNVAGLRRLINETAASMKLSTCSITLGGNRILADVDPSKVNVPKLPPHWSFEADDSAATGLEPRLRFPFSVPGKGSSELEIAGAATSISLPSVEAELICVAGLCASMFVYRRTRKSLAETEMVHSALVALDQGETSATALKVNSQLGPVAIAWNKLIIELEDLRHRVKAAAMTSVSGNRREGGNNLEAACDAMSQGLVLVDDRMRVRFSNGAARTFLRLDQSSIGTVAVADLVQDAKFHEAIEAIAAGKLRRPVTIELEQAADLGSGVLKFCIRPVRRGDADSAMIIIEDITSQRTAERARNSFINQVTHELRTPLTNIRLYTETAIEDGEANPEVRANCLNVINQESRRLERIVGEMLSVAEIESGSSTVHRDEIYFDVLVKELHNDYRPQAEEKHIKLEFNVSPKLPKIIADKDKLTIAIHNLVGNALKYTPEGGKVTVTVDVRDEQLAIDVADTGIGIKPEEADKIFDRFFRSADPRVGKIVGTGLGLTLAREVMRLHGGDVTVQSEINRGSTFIATLPLLNAAA